MFRKFYGENFLLNNWFVIYILFYYLYQPSNLTKTSIIYICKLTSNNYIF